MRLFSSQDTVSYKRAVPAYFALFAVFFASAPRREHAGILDHAFSLFLLVTAFFVVKHWRRIPDEVWEDGDALVVRRDGREERVKFADILHLEICGGTPPWVTLTLREVCSFGKTLTFMPSGKPDGFWGHPIVCELVGSVSKARHSAPETLFPILNELLRRICSTLNQRSLNYSVNIQLYSSPGRPGRSPREILADAIGPRAVMDTIGEGDSAALMESVREGLSYEGDPGCHPNMEFLASAAFKTASEEILTLTDKLFAGSDRIRRFTLKEGHPFYPVFWDFAWLVENGNQAWVLIGSSSD